LSALVVGSVSALKFGFVLRSFLQQSKGFNRKEGVVLELNIILLEENTHYCSYVTKILSKATHETLQLLSRMATLVIFIYQKVCLDNQKYLP